MFLHKNNIIVYKHHKSQSVCWGSENRGGLLRVFSSLVACMIYRLYQFIILMQHCAIEHQRTAGLQGTFPVCDHKPKAANFLIHFGFDSGRLQSKGWMKCSSSIEHSFQCNNQWIYLFECYGNLKHMWRSIVWQMEKGSNEGILWGPKFSL